MNNNQIHNDDYWKKRSIKSKLYLGLQILLGIPKTLIFNTYYFGIAGLKIPVLLSYKVKLKKLRGQVVIDAPLKSAMIKLGFTTSEMFDNSKESFLWINDGVVTFKGKAGIRNGVVLRNYGELVLGDEFHISSPSRIVCYKKIVFGKDILIGWNCHFEDGDAHKIFIDTDELMTRLNNDAQITIGDHVWFCANVQVHKGVTIGNNVVVAANSVLLKPFVGDNMVIGGMPIRCLKSNINWRV